MEMWLTNRLSKICAFVRNLSKNVAYFTQMSIISVSVGNLPPVFRARLLYHANSQCAKKIYCHRYRLHVRVSANPPCCFVQDVNIPFPRNVFGI